MKNIHVIATDKTSKLQLNVNTKKLILFDNIQSNNESVHLTTQHIYITSDEEIKEGDWFYNTISLKPEPFKACENGDRYVNCSRYSHNRIDCKKIILTTDQDLIKDGVQSIDDKFLEWFVKNPSCEEVETYSLGVKNQLTGESGHYKYEIIIPKEEPIHLLSNNGRALFGYKTIIQKEEQCTCKEHDPYCCQIHGNCPTCVKEEPKQELNLNCFDCNKSLQDCTCMEDTINMKTELGEAAEKYCLINNIPIDQMIVKNDRSCEFKTPITMFIEGAKWQQERMYSEEEVLAIIFQKRMSYMTDTQIIEWFEQFKKK
jgi:hypothetical protein